MNARRIRGPPHQSVQRIDLPDQVPLANSANRRIARHLPDRLDPMSQQQRPRPHASRSRGRLTAGMPAPDHHDVISRCHCCAT